MPDLPDLSQIAVPGLMYLSLETPLGTANIDPFAAAQDSQTQAIMQALGLHVTIGFGPVPALDVNQPSLGQNLKVLAIVGVGAIGLWLFSRKTPRRVMATA